MKEIMMSNCKSQSLRPRSELDRLFSVQWDDLSEHEKVIEKLSDGPIWSCYKTVVLDELITYEHYLEYYYDYEV